MNMFGPTLARSRIGIRIQGLRGTRDICIPVQGTFNTNFNGNLKRKRQHQVLSYMNIHNQNHSRMNIHMGIGSASASLIPKNKLKFKDKDKGKVKCSFFRNHRRSLSTSSSSGSTCDSKSNSGSNSNSGSGGDQDPNDNTVHTKSILPPFPWVSRHCTDPLPRIITGDDLSGVHPRPRRAKIALKLAAAVELQVTKNWWQLLLFMTGIQRSHEHELCDSFVDAFCFTSICLLSRYYNLNYFNHEDKGGRNGNGIVINVGDGGYTLDALGTNEGTGTNTNTDTNESEEKFHPPPHRITTEDDQMQIDEEFISNMVEENLLKLYTPKHVAEAIATATRAATKDDSMMDGTDSSSSAPTRDDIKDSNENDTGTVTDSDKDTDRSSGTTTTTNATPTPTRRVFLELKPTNAEIVNYFLVPVITREHVKKDPTLKHSYMNIELKYKETKQWSLIDPMFRAVTEKVRAMAIDNMEQYLDARTIIVDVRIDCLERFYVSDGDGDDHDDGDDDVSYDTIEAKETTHLVRFEMVTKSVRQSNDNDNNNITKIRSPLRELGQWIITDIDDQLDGNIWH